tara:strand:- start:150 stop:377 length:228 start_codon:yes stop_codon:yes gene_type:complete
MKGIKRAAVEFYRLKIYLIKYISLLIHGKGILQKDGEKKEAKTGEKVQNSRKKITIVINSRADLVYKEVKVHNRF